MNEDELITIVDQELANAIGKPSSRLSKARENALRYYNGEATGELAPPEAEGRSSVVSMDVAETVEWILPSLLRIFTGSDEAVNFEPTGEEDEEAAKQATDYANYVFYRQNDGFVAIHNWFKDALLQRLGVVKVWWDDQVDVVTEEYHAMTPEDLALLTKDQGVEPIQANPNEDGTFDVKVKRKQGCAQVRIENVPPEEFLFSRKARSADRIFSCHHRVLRSMSELKAMGYKNLDRISSDESVTEYSTERVQRRLRTDDYIFTQSDPGPSIDESMRMVWITESYLQVDWNGDGIAEWRKVVKANKTLLENVEVDGHCFVMLTPILMPHELVGKSIADLTMDLQKIKTALFRQLLDNMYLQNNQRIVIDETKSVNIDDLLDSRVGGVIRTKDVNAVRPFEVPQLGASSYSMLEYIDTMKENRTGVTRYNQGLDADSLNKTATGVNAIMNAAQQRIELIARVFAETGVKDLFRKILKLSSQYNTRAQTIRLRNKWTQIDPRAWKNQYDVSINVGLGTGNKDQMAAHLMNILQVQREAMQIGVSSPKHIFNAASKLAVNLGFKDGTEFFIDPTDPQMTQALPPPAPPPPDPQLMKVQQDGELKARELQQADQHKATDVQIKKYEIDTKAQLELVKHQAELQSKEAVTTAQLQQADAHHARMLEAGSKPSTEVRFDAKEEMGALGEAVKRTVEAQATALTQGIEALLASSQAIAQAAQMLATSATAPKSVSMRTSGGKTLTATVQPAEV